MSYLDALLVCVFYVIQLYLGWTNKVINETTISAVYISSIQFSEGLQNS